MRGHAAGRERQRELRVLRPDASARPRPPAVPGRSPRCRRNWRRRRARGRRPGGEWASMIPGVTHLPVPSISCAPHGEARSGPPTAWTMPSAKTTVPSLICWPSPLKTVAWRMTVGHARIADVGRRIGILVDRGSARFGFAPGSAQAERTSAASSAASKSLFNTVHPLLEAARTGGTGATPAPIAIHAMVVNVAGIGVEADLEVGHLPADGFDTGELGDDRRQNIARPRSTGTRRPSSARRSARSTTW